MKQNEAIFNEVKEKIKIIKDSTGNAAEKVTLNFYILFLKCLDRRWNFDRH